MKKTKYRVKKMKKNNGINLRLVGLLTLLLLLPLFLVSSRSVQNLRQSAAPSGESFVFTAAGDYGNGSEFQETVKKVGAENPTFHIVLGDFSYEQGAERAWCNTWKASVKNVALIVGNHDSGQSPGGNIDNYIKACQFSIQGVQGEYGKQYYFDYPTTKPIARFILVSPGLEKTIGYDYSADGDGYTFTEKAVDDARQKQIPWIILSFHKNCVSAGEKKCEIGEEFMDLLLEKKVDLILQGHEHSYLRSHQLSCAKINSTDPSCIADKDNNFEKGVGPIINIIGTGGHNLRSINNNDSEKGYFPVTDNTTHGVGKFTVSPTEITYTFVPSGRGNLKDSYTITGNGESLTGTQTPSPTGTDATPPPATPTFTCLGSCPTNSPTSTDPETPAEEPNRNKNKNNKNNNSEDSGKEDDSDETKDEKNKKDKDKNAEKVNKNDKGRPSLRDMIRDLINRIKSRFFN